MSEVRLAKCPVCNVPILKGHVCAYSQAPLPESELERLLDDYYKARSISPGDQRTLAGGYAAEKAKSSEIGGEQ